MGAASASQNESLLVDDLFSDSTESTLGGAGPFVINLSSSPVPTDLPDDGISVTPGTRIYQIRRMEDRRVRYRLRLGPFVTESQANAVLGIVRDGYPAALTATACAEDIEAFEDILRTRAAPGASSSAAASAKSAPPTLTEPVKAPSSPLTQAVRTFLDAPPKAASKPAPAVLTLVPDPPVVRPAPPDTAKRAPLTAAPALKKDVAAATATPAPVPAAAKSASPTALSLQTDTARLAAKQPANPAPPPNRNAATATPPAAASRTAAAPMTLSLQLETGRFPAKTPAPAASPPASAMPLSLQLETSRLPARQPVQAAPPKRQATLAEEVSITVSEMTLELETETPPRQPSASPSTAASSSRPPDPPSSKAHVDLESTQTMRALTSSELEDKNALRWFVIELSVAEHAYQPDAVPDLDIFSVYRLYAVETADRGRPMHALRLGFFSEETAAMTVAAYLSDHYESPTVKRVSIAEHERFKERRLEARKKVEATGRHMAIEITDQRYVREISAVSR
jgi:hypothetical protein